METTGTIEEYLAEYLAEAEAAPPCAECGGPDHGYDYHGFERQVAAAPLHLNTSYDNGEMPSGPDRCGHDGSGTAYASTVASFLASTHPGGLCPDCVRLA